MLHHINVNQSELMKSKKIQYKRKKAGNIETLNIVWKLDYFKANSMYVPYVCTQPVPTNERKN